MNETLDNFALTKSNLRNLRHNFYKLLEIENEYEELIWNVIEALDDLQIVIEE